MINTLPGFTWLSRFTFHKRNLSIPEVTTMATHPNDWGGKEPVPGVYASSFGIVIQNGDLTLDARGDADAAWYFKTPKSIVTIGGAGGNVVLKGGAQASRVFWETDRAIHIGRGTSFVGNLKNHRAIPWWSFILPVFSTERQRGFSRTCLAVCDLLGIK